MSILLQKKHLYLYCLPVLCDHLFSGAFTVLKYLLPGTQEFSTKTEPSYPFRKCPMQVRRFLLRSSRASSEERMLKSNTQWSHENLQLNQYQAALFLPQHFSAFHRQYPKSICPVSPTPTAALAPSVLFLISVSS